MKGKGEGGSFFSYRERRNSRPVHPIETFAKDRNSDVEISKRCRWEGRERFFSRQERRNSLDRGRWIETHRGQGVGGRWQCTSQMEEERREGERAWRCWCHGGRW